MQVAESQSGSTDEIVEHVGSAHSAAELGVLVARAYELIDELRHQPPLDVEVPAVVVPLATEPARPANDLGPPQPALPGTEDPVPAGPVDRPAQDGPGRVLGTASVLLYEALAGIYDALGFDVVDDAVFKDLAITRVVEPTSLLDSARVLTDLGRRPASYATMKRTLLRVVASGYRDQLAARCFDHATKHGDTSLVLYDVTSLYFEAEKEDDLRKIGYSKERRVDPQILVGLLVDRRGFPLEIECFEGNKAEKLTIVPIVEQFKARHDLAEMVVVADAGMLSAANLKALDEAKLTFIVGSRTTKAPVDLASHFRWRGDAFTDGQIIDTITPRIATTAARKVNDPAVKTEPVWDPETHTLSWRAIWAYSHTRAQRDRRTLGLQEEKAKAVVNGEKAARTPRFVKAGKDGHVLDQASLARAYRLVGLKGYVTNIPAATMPATEVISSYHDLWQVEQSFRMSKSDLRARPMFHHVKDSIEAHLTIVFTALAVSREVQARTGHAIRHVIRKLRPLRSATIAINGAHQTFPPAIGPDQSDILDKIARSR